MRPGADGQKGMLAVLTQGTIVAQLPGQKNIVPSTHQMDRHRDILNGLIKTAPFPVRITRLVVYKPLLKERNRRACGKRVKIAQREVCEKRAQLAARWKQERREHVHALLMHDQICPGESGIQ